MMTSPRVNRKENVSVKCFDCDQALMHANARHGFKAELRQVAATLEALHRLVATAYIRRLRLYLLFQATCRRRGTCSPHIGSHVISHASPIDVDA